MTRVNKRKRPLEDITSHSQQNKRFNSFGKDVKKSVDELIVKHKLTNLSGEPIVNLHHIGFDYKENQAYIKFKDSNPITQAKQLDAVVRVCDEALLSRDGYRHLAAVVPTLFREYLVADRRNEINKLINAQIHVEIFNTEVEIGEVENREAGNGAYRSLLTLLKTLIPVWKGGENPIIIPGDTLYIKLGGDGRNVGRKQNHVMVTFCLLNEKDEVLKPNHQFRYDFYMN